MAARSSHDRFVFSSPGWVIGSERIHKSEKRAQKLLLVPPSLHFPSWRKALLNLQRNVKEKDSKFVCLEAIVVSWIDALGDSHASSKKLFTEAHLLFRQMRISDTPAPPTILGELPSHSLFPLSESCETYAILDCSLPFTHS